MKTILITGAAGDVGTHLRRELAGKYRIRASDLRNLKEKFKGQQFMRADISKFADALKITKGVDAIIHLGGYSVEGPWEGILNANIDGDKAREFFVAGKSPYYLTGPWNIPAIAEAGINYAIDPLPSAGGQEARPFVGVNGFFLSSKSENALAATDFIVNYLSTEDAQLSLFEVGGRPPALISAYESAAASDPDVEAFGKIGQTGAPMPAIPEMGAVWSDWGNAELQLIKGEGEPAQVWETAATNIQSKIG